MGLIVMIDTGGTPGISSVSHRSLAQTHKDCRASERQSSGAGQAAGTRVATSTQLAVAVTSYGHATTLGMHSARSGTLFCPAHVPRFGMPERTLMLHPRTTAAAPLRFNPLPPRAAPAHSSATLDVII